MDIKQIEYIVAIADEGSITKAAERMFITQSALSQQLLKLEKELGTALFIRSKPDWKLTEEGAVYIEAAREMIRIKQRTYSEISDMNDLRNGHISFGITSGRCPDMLGSVFPAFNAEYPDIILEPHEMSVSAQQEAIHKGQLDFGFMTLTDQQKSDDNYILLRKEHFYIVVSEKYPIPEQYNTGEEFPVLPLEVLKYEPYISINKRSTSYRITAEQFSKAGFVPNTLMETSINMTILSLIRKNLAFGILPEYYVRLYPEGLKFYSLQDPPEWNICACYQKGTRLSKPASRFIELSGMFLDRLMDR